MEKALAIQKQVAEILGTDEVYLVGGSVRDIVMGNEPKDYDFCTPMLPDDIEARVQAAGRHAYGIGKKFGTIGFKVKGPIKTHNVTLGEDGMMDGGITWETEPGFWGWEYVEVTTFRSEVYTSKSRKPEVAFVPSLEEDLARRDFTFNAMVLKPNGEIYDPYGGRIDILGKLIKTVGLPKDRIQEDPLRILRAARFAARYDFEVDPNFIGKARQLADRIYDVSIERWVQELDKTLVSKLPYWGFVKLHEAGVLSRILPELYSDESHVNPFDCRGEQQFDNPDEAWAFLLDNIHVPQNIKQQNRARRYVKSGIVQRLKFSNDRSKFILDNKKA